MSKREAAIVSAYTGYLIGAFSDFQAYAEEIMGRPIFTHDLTRLEYELKEKSKKDFMNIIVLSDKEYNELIATSSVEGYDKGYRDGKKDAIDNLWSELRDRTEK